MDFDVDIGCLDGSPQTGTHSPTVAVGSPEAAEAMCRNVVSYILKEHLESVLSNLIADPSPSDVQGLVSSPEKITQITQDEVIFFFNNELVIGAVH
jgi:hypothetical protein